jgi:diguanylate cyclase (GGDEF)-like protein
VVLEKKPVIVKNVRNCPFFSDRIDRLTGFKTKSIICVPLIFGGHPLGVLEVVNPRKIGDGSIPLLTLIAEYAAIAVENMRRYCQIEDLAIKDPLTGLYNTRYLYHALEQLIGETNKRGRSFSLIFMDLDDFKIIVDTYGHINGSQAIREVAMTIQESIPKEAFGVSYGGDEFVVVLPGLNKFEAIKEAERIRSKITNTIYLSNKGLKVFIRASFGVATYPDDATDLTGLLALADKAMFNVKRRGKDAVSSG